MINNMVDDIDLIAKGSLSPINRVVIPFIVCGNLNNYDSDMSYPLNVNDNRAFHLRNSVYLYFNLFFLVGRPRIRFS
jgi:tRNA (cytidine32/guanosine34-2'-O)-methyltransferase